MSMFPKKLTAEQVRRMRDLREQGWTLHRLADEFGVHNATVWKICQRFCWKRCA